MPATTPIKPTHRPIQTYYESLHAYGDHALTHETALRSTFQNLLAETGRSQGWTLIPEQGLNVQGRTVRPDGTLRDEFNLPRDIWWRVIFSDIPIR